MLTTQGETSEQDVLKRIQIARGNAEPDPAPTEEPSAVDVSEEEAPAEEVEETVEEQSEETLEAEEEAVEDAEPLESEDDGEDLYVEYKGREINLKDIEEWEQGSLRQADYTRKTQELSEQRKSFEAEREQFNEASAKLNTQIAELEAIISEETLSPEAIAEMREYEPEEYIKYQEKLEKRKEALSKSKQSSQPTSVDVNAERQKLWDANPSWMDNGKQTKAFEDDMQLLNDYAATAGFTSEELAGLQSAHHLQTLMDAARFKALGKKNAAIEKKVRKAPVTTKPKQAASTSLQQQVKAAEKRLKQTGKAEDAVKLRQLRRKLSA